MTITQTTPQQAIQPTDQPVIGSLVTYHGSLPDLHGRTFLLLPDTNCRFCDPDDDGPRHYTLADPDTSQALKHARPSSFTPTATNWWPSDAIDFNIAGYRYKAAYTTPGGSRWARIVHCHTATGTGYRVWCRFDGDPAPEVRALDARRLV
ncbi:hypothetical protein [Streptomyces hygroscopicus]|uniref:hypothetical protein n=1 Tax=Streptomyces hygroscopicus TaxID=1912 RepID=UPI0033FDE016